MQSGFGILLLFKVKVSIFMWIMFIYALDSLLIVIVFYLHKDVSFSSLGDKCNPGLVFFIVIQVES